MTKESKEKLGKIVYQITLSLALVAVVAGFFIKKGNEDTLRMLRYAIFFYVFIFLLPLGIITNELLSGKFVKKKMIYKIVANFLIFLFGTVLFFFVWKVDVLKFSMYVSLLVLIFTIRPTLPPIETKVQK